MEKKTVSRKETIKKPEKVYITLTDLKRSRKDYVNALEAGEIELYIVGTRSPILKVSLAEIS